MKVKFDFKPSDFLEGIRIKSKDKKRILEDIGDIVLTEVTSMVGSGISPVTGRKFKKLSKEYIEKKKEEGGTILGGGGSNLELTGDMLQSLFVEVKDNKITLTVSDSEQGKADGHNNFSGKSSLPERKFIPNEKNGETFIPKIRKAIKDYLIQEVIDVD
jgi:hypothetical protein